MPTFVVELIGDALNNLARSIRGSSILIIGVAYKRDVGDTRESPALDVIRILTGKGAVIDYFDPYCSELVDTSVVLASVPLSASAITNADVVVILTDHTHIDYALIAEHAKLIVDTRGIMRSYPGRAEVIGLSGRATATGDIREYLEVTS